jgi:hypothetical protein
VKTLCSRVSTSRFSNETPVYVEGSRVNSVAPTGGGAVSRGPLSVARSREQLAAAKQDTKSSRRTTHAMDDPQNSN